MAFIQLKTYSETLRTKTSIQVILPTPLAGETNGSFYDSDRKFPTAMRETIPAFPALRVTPRNIMWLLL